MMGRQIGDLFPFEENLSGGGSVIARDKVEIGGFPCAIWTDNGVNIPFQNFKAYLVYGSEFSEFFCYPLRLEKHISSKILNSKLQVPNSK
jgi:hypothetical protein